jgi:hypothetical protein
MLAKPAIINPLLLKAANWGGKPTLFTRKYASAEKVTRIGHYDVVDHKFDALVVGAGFY